jgi:predicted nucleic acid-binding protein
LTRSDIIFVFDAGPLSRLYLRDLATRNVRAIFARFRGAIHAPSIAHAEDTAAWLQAVRTGEMQFEEYRECLAAFVGHVRDDAIRLWREDDLLLRVLAVQEEVTRLHLGDRSRVPIVHAHDAYYIALAQWLRTDLGCRVVLVTNDGRVWRVARAMGLEVFHGNTCDLGLGRLHVGATGQHFAEGRRCSPCLETTCPSSFDVDLAGTPVNLGSGEPRPAHLPATN